MNPTVRKFIPALALVAAVALGYYAWSALRNHGPNEGLASGNGRIEATEVDVATRLAGRVEDILVREGDFVSAGQPLARMQIDSLQAQRDEALARYQQALQAVAGAEAQVALRDSDHQAAQALVVQRESELDAAQRRLVRSETLAREGASSGQELDDDRAKARSAQAAVVATKAQVAAARAAIRQLGTQISVVLQLRGYAVPGTEVETEVDHYGFGAHYVLRAIVRPEFTKAALEEILRQGSGQIVLHVSADADRVTAVAQILYQLRLYDSVFHTSRLTGVASIVHSFRGLANIGRNAARLFVLQQPDVYYIQLIEQLNAITARQIDQAIAFHFVSEVAQLVLAGDPQLIESQLRGTDLGTVQRVLPD